MESERKIQTRLTSWLGGTCLLRVNLLHDQVGQRPSSFQLSLRQIAIEQSLVSLVNFLSK